MCMASKSKKGEAFHDVTHCVSALILHESLKVASPPRRSHVVAIPRNRTERVRVKGETNFLSYPNPAPLYDKFLLISMIE